MSDCLKQVWDLEAGRSRQCNRKAAEEGYCKQHGRTATAARQEKSIARFRAAIDLRAQKADALRGLISAVRLSRDLDILPSRVTAALEAYEALGL